MGREIKRVPLDFDWPIKKVWEGFVNPYYKECAVCGGSGSTTAMQRLEDLVSLLMISGEDSARGKSHPFFDSIPLHNTEGIAPSKDMAELTGGLAGRPPDGRLFWHSSCDCWAAVRKIVEAAGLTEKWGWCQSCNGEGIDPDAKEKYDAWEETEPPLGEGYQVWETVSEGSPVSPVFETKDGVVSWLIEQGYSKQGAEEFIKTGWAMSGAFINGKSLNGIDALGELKDRR